MKEPMIRLQSSEESGTADCGCVLGYDDEGSAVFYQCPMHEAAKPRRDWAGPYGGLVDIVCILIALGGAFYLGLFC